MATVKICTTGGGCIRCAKTTTAETKTALEVMEKNGDKYYCCGNQCVRIDQITTIVEESQTPPKTDDDDHSI